MRPSTARWFEGMHRAHEEFRRSVAQLHAALRACHDGPDAGVSACVRAEFDSFARLLRRHFAQEELAGPFRPECAATAAARRWAERTVAAHRTFESRLDALGRLLDAPGDAVRFEAGLRALIDDLFEHELSEERLVQRFVFEEPDALDPAL